MNVKDVLKLFNPTTEVILHNMKGDVLVYGTRKDHMYLLEKYLDYPVIDELWISSDGSLHMNIDDMT